VKLRSQLLIAVSLLLFRSALAATPTENLGIHVLPVPGPVTIDGKTDDWDLSAGVFACGSVEDQRDSSALWIHMMYDARNLYVLAHFIDPTPLNNPGQTIGDYGFNGDSLQLRFDLQPGTPAERVSHWTCWRGSDQKDLMDVVYGVKLNEGNIKDAKTRGAQQAFAVDADGKGYVQELAIPWNLLSKDGTPVSTGGKFMVTLEANFTVGAKGRLSVKDIFKSGVKIDRVFTFQGPGCWGWATCEEKGRMIPPPVRLADGREIPVKLEHGVPVADWSGLSEAKAADGFKPITFEMPVDGYISLNIFDREGRVVRQLLNCQRMTKGQQTVKWDGLTTPSWNVPGAAVAPGEYTWSAIYHGEIGLRLRGWACNAGAAPWDGPSGRDNWGGDHGVPAACATEGDSVFLGWSSAEAGKALLACDLDGHVKWKNNRQGIAGASQLAMDRGIVYVVNGNDIYRLDAHSGAYSAWPEKDSPDLFLRELFPNSKNQGETIDGLDVRNEKLFFSRSKENRIACVDVKSGALVRMLSVPSPSALKLISDSLLYVVSDRKNVLAVDAGTGEAKTLLSGLSEVHALTVDKAGNVYVGLREPENCVLVFDPNGKQIATIGRKGGRAKIGPWTSDGMLFISSLCIDSAGKLWVTEADTAPKRISVWDSRSGKFIQEFFGPTTYGAIGGAINPRDPNIMAGQGCEWRIDPQSGRATCLGTITRDGMENARFCVGSNGRVYLAVAGNWLYTVGPLRIYERIGDADYRLRTSIVYVDGAGNEAPPAGVKPGSSKRTLVWADENGDGQRQPEEITGADGELRFSAWYMNIAPDLTLYSGDRQFKVTGFTSCGAPKYDLTKPIRMPAPGLGSADGQFVLQPGDYGVDHGTLNCYDIASGKKIWTCPDTFNGVHGSHNAPPTETGLIRGSYGPCGTVKLPQPIGNVWVLPTNVGEWHVLTERGFYLTRFFEGDAMKVAWPEKAQPGVSLDHSPPGQGGEDFGGSVTLGHNGKLYLQAGKTAFWNVEVTGLDSVREVKGGTIEFSEADSKQAVALRAERLPDAKGHALKQMAIKRSTPTFTGDIAKDFDGSQTVQFQKADDTAIRATAAWDDQNLYLAWDVTDTTPWRNSAEIPEEMYVRGDTVDFQIGTDPNAPKNRSEAVLGDLRLSIGNFKGKPTAVAYRKVAKEKHPKTFSSGIVKEYVMDSVVILEGAKIAVAQNPKGYVVEAAIPLSALDLRPADGLALRGDFGATHGDASGRTRLRTYWSNQHTGIVDDAVYELQLEPRNWGELTFKK
jgi:outer membrane protein assembly factor BamB